MREGPNRRQLWPALPVFLPMVDPHHRPGTGLGIRRLAVSAPTRIKLLKGDLQCLGNDRLPRPSWERVTFVTVLEGESFGA